MDIKILQASVGQIKANKDELMSWVARGLLDELPRNAEDLMAAALRNEMQIICVVDSAQRKILAVVVTEIIDYHSHSELFVVTLACEDFEKIKKTLDQFLVEMAVRENCRCISSLSRFGMKKVLNELGYESKFILMQKPVERG